MLCLFIADGELHEGEYVADVAVQKRARNVVGACMKFNERFKPESGNVTLFHLAKPPRKSVQIQIFLKMGQTRPLFVYFVLFT